MRSIGRAGAIALFACLSQWFPPPLRAETPPPSPRRAILYRATPIVNAVYPAVVSRAMRGAKRSIKIVMFSISAGYSPRNPMSTLMEECIGAARRGLRVTVIADFCDHADGNLYAINARTLEYLNENGVETYFDHPKTKTHDKVVLIDDATLIVGSHNWSKAAMSRNVEVSIMITSSPPDPAFARYVEEIKSACLPSRI